MNVILENVTKFYSHKLVLDRVSITVKKGNCVALLGPSGCGKTTLLNALAGLTEINGGTIQVGGMTWSARGFNVAPEQRNIGMVFQDFALWPHMNVFENVAFSLRLKKCPAREIKSQVALVLESVQMKDFTGRFPHQLSGGQKQRVAIARALISRPSLLLMDEPLSSLDAQLREKMRWEILKIIQGAGITTFYVTHDQTEAMSLADQVVLLNQGRVEQTGTPTQLYREPATVFAATFLGCSNILEGQATEVNEKYTIINCQNLKIYTFANLSPGEQARMMIRPADIMINTRGQNPGSLLKAVIQQRSFQGINWQYRVALAEAPNIRLEVWDTREMAVSDIIQLWLPADRLRILKEAM